MTGKFLRSRIFTTIKVIVYHFIVLVSIFVINSTEEHPKKKRRLEITNPGAPTQGVGAATPHVQQAPLVILPPSHPSLNLTPPQQTETSSLTTHEESKKEEAVPQHGADIPVWFINICDLLKTFKEKDDQQALAKLDELYKTPGALPGQDIIGLPPRNYWGRMYKSIEKNGKQEAIATLSSLIKACTIEIISHALNQSGAQHQATEAQQKAVDQSIIPIELPTNDTLVGFNLDTLPIPQGHTIVGLRLRQQPLNLVGQPQGSYQLDGHTFSLQNVDGLSMRCFFNAIGLVRQQEIQKLIAHHNDPIVRYMIANEIVSAAANPEQIPPETKEAIDYKVYQVHMQEIAEQEDERAAILSVQTSNANHADTSQLSELHQNIGKMSEAPLNDLRRRAFILKAFNSYIKHYIGNDEMMVALQDITGNIGGNENASYTSIDAIAYINNIAIKIYQPSQEYGGLRLVHQYIPAHATEIVYLYHHRNHFQALVLQQAIPIAVEQEEHSAKFNYEATRATIQALHQMGALPGIDLTDDVNYWGRILSLITKQKGPLIKVRLQELKKKLEGIEGKKKESKELKEAPKFTPIKLFSLNPSSQPEEKWRWRNSFQLMYQGHGQKDPYHIDFSNLHRQLSAIRKQVEADGFKYMESNTANVLVPAISIIYSTKAGKLGHVSGFLPEYTRDGISKTDCMVFLSGTGRKDLPNSVSLDNLTFHPTKGDFMIGYSDLQFTKGLQTLYGFNSNRDDPLYNFRTFILEVLSHPPTGTANFGTYFYHSEQWYIYHLFSSIPLRFNIKYSGNKKIVQLGNLCLAIMNVLRASPDIHDITTIHEVIFHLESTHDICDVCSPTLGVFTDYLNTSTAHITPLLKQIATTYLQKPDFEISEHMRFFIITSAFRSDLGQAKLRQFYNRSYNVFKAQRREHFGRDGVTDQVQAIEITPEIPYLYVQVPVDEDGIPLKRTG